MGVTIWEILTQGDNPYNWTRVGKPRRIISRILSGEKRLEFPELSPEAVVRIARACLCARESRPSAQTLVSELRLLRLPSATNKQRVPKGASIELKAVNRRGGGDRTAGGNDSARGDVFRKSDCSAKGGVGAYENVELDSGSSSDSSDPSGVPRSGGSLSAYEIKKDV